MSCITSLLATFLMLTSGNLFAEAEDATELTAILTAFLAGASINDADAHERFWAEDLIYTTSSGERIGKADIMSEVRAPADRSAAEDPTVYTAEDIRIQQYGDTAIVAFRLVGTSSVVPTVDGAPPTVSYYFNTGTFLRRDGVWQVVAWQATRIPAAE